MTPREIVIIQDVLEEIVGDADVLTSHFFSRLGHLDSSLANISPDLGHWVHAGFIAILATITSELANPDRILSLLTGLAKRHLRPWSIAADLEHVRSALVWALQEVLGENLTLEIERAWLAGCDMLIERITDSPDMADFQPLVIPTSGINFQECKNPGR